MCVFQVTGHYVSVAVFERVGLSTLCDQLLELVRRVRQLRLDANEYTCLKYIILLNSGLYFDSHVVCVGCPEMTRPPRAEAFTVPSAQPATTHSVCAHVYRHKVKVCMSAVHGIPLFQ